MLTTEPYSVPPEERQEYQEHVAALFTAPIMTPDQLLTNLGKYWPGEPTETLPGLVAQGCIERTPTGRYRLPLPPGIPAEATDQPATPERSQETIPAPANTEQHQPAAAAPLPRPPAAAPLPLFRPLRLTIPAVARPG